MRSESKTTLALALSAVGLLAVSALFDPLAEGLPQNPMLRDSARLLSLAGNGGVLLGASLIIFLGGRGLTLPALKDAGKDAFFSVAASGIIVNILKAAFERPRASHALNSTAELLSNPALFDVTGRFNSFPSGHSVAAFAFAYAVSRQFPRLRVLLYMLAGLVALSRVYLGSHYPTDVVAGAMTGVAFAWLASGNIKEKGREWRVALFLTLVLFISFFKLNGYLLFDVDEAVFSEAGREMVLTGDYITPTYNLEPRYDKPILFYWFSSAAFGLFGISEFSARFTSASFGALLTLMTFLFVRRVKGSAPAYLSALALLLNIEFFMYTHSAVTDMTLGFFITASIYSLFIAVKEERQGFFFLFWISSALAVLTKGAVGLLFPLSAAVPYLLLTKDIGSLKRLFRPLHVAAFLAVALPWFLAEFYINGMEFFDAFIVKHHIKRYSEVISSHNGPFYYYIGVLAIGFFPWAGLLPYTLYRAGRAMLDKGEGIKTLCAVWFFLVLVFFSVAKTKLPNYIFPLIPPASILAGLYLADIMEGRAASRSGLYAVSALSFGLAMAAALAPSVLGPKTLQFPSMPIYAASAIFASIGLFSMLSLARPRAFIPGVFAGATVLLIFLRLSILPPINAFLQKTLYEYSVYARRMGPEVTLATYELNRPSIAFYSGKRVLKIEKINSCDIKERGKKGAILVITETKRLNATEELKALKVIADKDGLALLTNTDALPGPEDI